MESVNQELDQREIWWILHAQAGDREALDKLLRLTQEPLYRYIYSLVGNRPLAEDILQEVFILIYRKLRWLREPGLFRAWAYRIAAREAFRQLKRERRWSGSSVEESVLADLPAPARDDLSPQMIEQMVAGVSPASRAVIVLHYQHEMPLAEIADLMGVAVGTVKSRLAYGLDTLRKQLATRKTEGG
jgi:RNA polymerase sigma-70 factor (ECF subfamily)